LPALILGPLHQEIGVPVKRVPLQIGKGIGIAVKQPACACSADHGIGESLPQPGILDVVKVGSSTLFLLLFGLPPFPFPPISLVEREKIVPADEIQVQGTARCDHRADLEPAPNHLKRPTACSGFLPALLELVAWDE